MRRKKTVQLEITDYSYIGLPDKCTSCHTPMKAVWENNGFQEGTGPTKDEINHFECPNCGQKTL